MTVAPRRTAVPTVVRRSWRQVRAGPADLRLRRHPAVASTPVMALTAAGLYVSGGVLGLLGTLDAPSGMAVTPLRGLGVASLVTGGTLLAVRGRLPRWFYHLAVLFGTVLISAAVALTGSPTAALAFGSVYAFVAIDCFFFFSWPAALVHLTTAVVGAGVAFAAVGVPAAYAALPIGTTVAVALVVGRVVRQADTAETDGLTGLVNRRGFERVVRDAVARAARDDRPLALAFLDLDHLDLVYDHDGRAVGDRLLRRTTDAWQDVFGDGPLLARYDEAGFALVLPDHTAEGAAAVVADLRSRLRPPLTCLAGIAARAAGDSGPTLVERAHRARYEARRGGLDHIDDGPGIGPGPRGADLRRAIAAGELFCVYQPVVDLGADRLVGVEALVRWRHPTRGILGPDQFVPTAEAGDVIHDLGRWVALEACRQTVRWTQQHGFDGNIAVNVAGPELGSPGYATRLRSLLTDVGLAPGRLVLEVTETTMDADSPRVVADLSELRAHGIKIAIDDFGTGWSSLNRLDRLPFDILKIDRSFIEPLDRPGADTTVLQAVVALAAALGVDVVAEGIETDAQDELVRGLGCAFGQGYLYGRPREASGDSPPSLAVAPV